MIQDHAPHAIRTRKENSARGTRYRAVWDMWATKAGGLWKRTHAEPVQAGAAAPGTMATGRLSSARASAQASPELLTPT